MKLKPPARRKAIKLTAAHSARTACRPTARTWRSSTWKWWTRKGGAARRTRRAWISSSTGPAIWRGGYNSGNTNSVNNLYLDTECGINRVAIRSTLTPGTITLTATRDGLGTGHRASRIQTGGDHGRADRKTTMALTIGAPIPETVFEIGR